MTPIISVIIYTKNTGESRNRKGLVPEQQNTMSNKAKEYALQVFNPG